MSRIHSFLCGVPITECSGGLKQVGKATIKAHSSREEAFKCFAQALERKGYKRIEQRLFRKEGEPVIMVSKISKFGTILPMGKTDGTTSSGKRVNRPLHRKALVEGI